MKNGRRILGILLTLAMVIGLLPGMGFTAYADVPQEDSNDYVGYRHSNYGFDVYGKRADGTEIQTTFGNNGYTTKMEVGGSKTTFYSFEFGKEYIYNGVKASVTARVSGKAVLVTYTLFNDSDELKKVKIGSYADTQIGTNDSAECSFTENGIKMADGTLEFQLIPGGGNFTTRWYGAFYEAESNVFIDREDTSTYNRDSGIAWSWTIDIPARATITKTAVLSLGQAGIKLIIYDANGGTGAMDPTVDMPGASINLNKNTFTKDDYEFQGWDENSAGTTVVYADEATLTMPNTNTTLYAVWKEKPEITAAAEGFEGAYDGKEHGITVTVTKPSSGATIKYGKTAGTYDLDASPTITNVVDSPLTVYFKVTADGYKDYTGSATVTVSKADSTANAPTGLTATYGQTLANVSLEGKNPEGNTPGTWAWADSTQSVGNVVSPAATFKANFTPTSSNYKTVENVEVAVTVGKADPTAPTGLTATYGQTLANVTLPDGWTWADSTQSVGDVVDPAATFKANYAGDDNHKAASNVDVAVTVSKADPTAPTGLAATYGQTLANVTLPDGWTWADSTQSVGDVVTPAATFKANYAGDDNHNAASNVDVAVTVGKADPIAPTGLTATYGQTLANVTLPDGWTWADSTQSVGNVVDPAATFKANYAGDDNHNAASNVDVTVTVGKADATAPTGLTATYGQTLANVTLPDGWTWADSTQSVGDVVTPSATFKANYAGDDNHSAASNVDVAVTVSKADASVTKAPAAVTGLVEDGKPHELITAGEAVGGTMQYALGTATEATGSYATSIPTATDAGTYYVWYKVAGDENHNDSDPACATAVIKGKISATVTFKVVNGSWNDGEGDSKTVTLTGYEGDQLKLTADQIPAVGDKPAATFKAGTWDVVPSTETVISQDTTYTYTYVGKDTISATVTFKVANGSWNDGEGDSKTVTLTGYEGDQLKLTADQIPAVGDKPAATFKAGTWDVVPSTETVISQDTTYTYTYVGKDTISATVTFKVVNGSWNDGEGDSKTVTLTGYEGDQLKLTANQIPAVGEKPAATFKAGTWDVVPSTETVISQDTTYTYTYVGKDAISATVTFKVVNGSWDNGEVADKTVTLTGYEGDPLKLSADQIPAVGKKPAAGYKAGSWDTTPGTDIEIKKDTAFTYTYAAQDIYTVTVTNDGNGTGTATPSSGITGTEVTLAATPAAGYSFKEWQVVSGGVTVTGNTFKIGNANVEIKAIFTKDPVNYNIVSVTGSEHIISGGKNAGITVKGIPDDSRTCSSFTGAAMDGQPIPTGNYTAEEGSLILTLKASYLDTLSVGKHTLTINFTDGSADTTITVLAKPVPKTGDNSNPALWIALMILGLAGIGAMLFRTARKRG